MFLLFTKLKLFTKTKRLGFLKRNFKECFKNHGSSVIKEFFKKQGILKPGNFRTFKKPNFINVIDINKTVLGNKPMFLVINKTVPGNKSLFLVINHCFFL